MKNIFLLLFVLFIPVFSFAAYFSVGEGFKVFTDTLSNSSRFGNSFARINVDICGIIKINAI
ncbi:MAG: hypothetical protein K2N11_01670 [Mucispirillum sp.]|nr:hypothetical protein [Mucispirillum sp.]